MYSKKSENYFFTLAGIVFILLLMLFVYLFKIEGSIKNFDKYKNSLVNLRLMDKNFQSFFYQRNKLINFDGIVSDTESFEKNLEFLINSNIKKDFGTLFIEDLNEIQTLYEQKLSLIEDFKSNHSTTLNSIHYIFDLNNSIQKNDNINLRIKNIINRLVFNVFQIYIGIDRDFKFVKQKLEELKKYRNIPRIDYIYLHINKVLQLNNQSNKINKEASNILLEEKIVQTSNKLQIAYDKELFHQLIIALLFFFFAVTLIYFVIKSFVKTLKIQNELQSFKYAVQHSDNSIVLTDAKRNILYVNEIFESNSGYSKDEVLGNKPKVLSSGLTPNSSYEQLDYNLRKGKKWEGEFINQRKDGSIFYEKASIVPIFLDGKIINYLALKLDITKYIKQQEELKESAVVFENTQEGILVTNKDGIILSANKAFEEISGYTKEELIGTKPNVLKSSEHDKQFYKKMFKELNKKGYFKGKVYDEAKDGTKIPTWLNITAVRDENQKIIKYISIHTNLQEIIDTQKKAEFLAYYDSLTSLPNRVMLEEHLEHVLELSQRNKFNLAILFIDLDRFKIINDTLGHQVGDELIKVVAKRIKSVLRSSDMLARMGGDEFVVVLESAKNKNTAAFVCKKILNIVKQSIEIGAYKLNTSASIGVAMYPKDGNDLQKLVRNADTAMYHAKDQGKNTFEYYDKQLSDDVHEQLEIEQAFKGALSNKEFHLNYQAQYNLEDRKTYSYEALVRWNSKKLGFVSPGVFIPIAEDTGYIVKLGKFIFKKACEDFIKLKKLNTDLKYIAINISSIQFKDENFVNDIKNIIKEVGIEAKNIEIEITERYIMEFSDSNMNTLYELRKLGFRMSIDDFGTGYSSMSYLTKLPVDVIKVDKAFVDYLPDDNNNLQITKAIIVLAKSLGYYTVAEGIEHEKQEKCLKELGCDIGQGYFYAKPQSYEKIVEDYKKS
ncbi:MAG: EAL domain-containing protein [Campylobacterota bacterium]